jgi:chromate reductase
MSQPVHVLGFSGSLRRASYNTATLRAAQELLPAAMTLDLFDLTPLPLFNADLEADGVPDSVADFQRRIREADALLIATPEYNYSVSGVLKNAIDWASRGRPAPLDGKPMAIVGAGGRVGTVRAQNHLRQIAVHNDMHVLNKPQILIARAWEQFDDAGRLTNEETRSKLHTLLIALADWTRLLRGEPR